MTNQLQPIIDRARQNGINLSPADFRTIDGEPTLDGMDPAEWLDAMLMD